MAGTARSGGKRDGPRNEACMAQAAERSTREHSHRAAWIGECREAYAQKALYCCCSRLEIFERSRQGMELHDRQQKSTGFPALPRASTLADLQSLNRLAHRAVLRLLRGRRSYPTSSPAARCSRVQLRRSSGTHTLRVCVPKRKRTAFRPIGDPPHESRHPCDRPVCRFGRHQQWRYHTG